MEGFTRFVIGLIIGGWLGAFLLLFLVSVFSKPRRRILPANAPRRIDGESVEADLAKDYRGDLN